MVNQTGVKRKYTTVVPYVKTSVKKNTKGDHKLLMQLKKNLFQHEKKFKDVNVNTGYTLNGLSTLTLLNSPQQGTDENNRLGRQINMKSVQLRGTVQSAQTTVGQGAIRTIVIVDNEVAQTSQQGVTLDILDYLVSDSLQANANLNNRKRFKVLMDEMCEFSGTTTSTGNPTSHVINWYKKVDFTVEFNSNTNGNITDFTKGAVYLITYSEGLTIAAPLVNINARVRFTDN